MSIDISTQFLAPAPGAAPLDPEQLQRSLLPFGQSRMLPVEAYLDEAVLDWEKSNVFSDWVCVGRGEALGKPRTAAAFSWGETGALVTRTADGSLRAFENACRHRGHELLPCGGSSETRMVVCPYHAWTYEHSGDLRSAPRFPKDDSFDKSEFGLKKLAVREWHGWIFVAAEGRHGDFADHIGELEQIITNYDGADLVTCASHSYDIAANWKVIIENYQECYHCSSIHPELCAVSPPQSGENIDRAGNWVGGWMDLRDGMATMSLDGHSDGTVISRLDEVESRTVMYVAVMPNLLISLHPDYVMTHLLTPITPDQTHVTCSWAFPAEVAEREGFDPSYAVDFWDITNKQDWGACESVQRGMNTPGYEPGPLAPDEDGVYQFVTLLAKRYLGH
ncbi:MAG: aromatic ring-hydroxylating dioxygenase subunit alpha [Nocardioidaceae bacterium]|nr:MAG: aromatic ring-hydroxylating dioxygenase subunit alpha [Nocardioidaceae bacterium]